MSLFKTSILLFLIFNNQQTSCQQKLTSRNNTKTIGKKPTINLVSPPRIILREPGDINIRLKKLENNHLKNKTKKTKDPIKKPSNPVKRLNIFTTLKPKTVTRKHAIIGKYDGLRSCKNNPNLQCPALCEKLETPREIIQGSSISKVSIMFLSIVVLFLLITLILEILALSYLHVRNNSPKKSAEDAQKSGLKSKEDYRSKETTDPPSSFSAESSPDGQKTKLKTVLEKHRRFVRQKKKQYKNDFASTKFKKRGAIHIPLEVTKTDLNKKCRIPENSELPQVFYDETNNEQFDIGSNVDNIEDNLEREEEEEEKKKERKLAPHILDETAIKNPSKELSKETSSLKPKNAKNLK